MQKREPAATAEARESIDIFLWVLIVGLLVTLIVSIYCRKPVSFVPSFSPSTPPASPELARLCLRRLRWRTRRLVMAGRPTSHLPARASQWPAGIKEGGVLFYLLH